MRGEDHFGIVSRAAEMREKYGAFAYRAPVMLAPPAPPRPPMPAPKWSTKPKQPSHEQLNIAGSGLPETKNLSVSLIVRLVCKAWDVNRSGLMTKSKHSSDYAARARFAVYWLLKERLGLSSHMIGYLMGRRGHNGIIQGVRRARTFYVHDADWRKKYDRVVSALDGKPGEAP